ncbi:hypothetical protein [Sulfurospirillum deleyianum]|uniref:Uncharacterized protein n=1 Tax=Sulfurospirillum deleyianum (strain ATCC 51133 / DSM 6946 / 5175) TaxID=525898 RepID=D1B135_SULD5|nr:hypothetical protein [Sulfurospirillum deleyianum]ACZ11805.1 hypothetical protein Sdel_0772 [Sulfurospirillum deleyianum DSM 6946]
MINTPINKEESIAILDEYKNKLTPEQYRNIEWMIGHLSIEGMFPNRVEIDRAVRTETKIITYEEATAEILNIRGA